MTMNLVKVLHLFRLVRFVYDVMINEHMYAITR